MRANPDARFALSCKRQRSSRKIKLMPRSFFRNTATGLVDRRLTISICCHSCAARAKRRPSLCFHRLPNICFPERSRHLYSQSPAHSLRGNTHVVSFAPNPPAFALTLWKISPATLTRNGVGPYTPCFSIQSPFWRELYFSLAPVRDSPLKARTLLPVLFDCATLRSPLNETL
jgi:hypothetical protein